MDHILDVPQEATTHVEVAKLQEIEEVSVLKIEVSKWKRHASQFDEGMISLTEQKKVIQELREQWDEEIFFQKIRWEEMREKLKELKKYESMEKNKEHMVTLTQDLLSYRAPSPSYPVFFFEQIIIF